jgi:hypothetical protein
MSEESTSNTIDTIYSEMEEDKIHLDDLKLDRRLNKQDYDFITRLPLSAKQLINILYELYPSRSFSNSLEKNNNNEPTFVDLTSLLVDDINNKVKE